jgi:hypothetical protein
MPDGSTYQGDGSGAYTGSDKNGNPTNTTYDDIRVNSQGQFELRDDTNHQYFAFKDGTLQAENAPDDNAFRSPPVLVKRVDVSDQYANKIESAVNGLPDGERQVLQNGGYSVVAAGELKDVLPNGNGTDIAGITSTDKQMVVVPENVTDKDGNRRANADDPSGILRHEAGHGVDFSIDNFSQSDQFKQSYEKELDALPPDVKKQFDGIFIEGESDGDKTDATRREVFAEMVATLTGGNDKTNDDLLHQYFPQTLSLTSDQINQQFQSAANPQDDNSVHIGPISLPVPSWLRDI